MEALDQTLIERYWANEMSFTEKQNFEQRLALEAGLQQELEEFKLAMEAVKLAERNELLQNFKHRDRILDKKNKINSTGQPRYLWLLIATGILIVIIVSWYFLKPSTQTPQPADNTPPDTMTIDQKPAVKRDTPQIDEPKVEKKPEPIKEKSIETGSQLFAANFDTYKDDSMDPTSRSGEDELSPFEKFQLFYWEKKNAEALEEFKKMTPAQQGNPNLRFFQAIALMAVNSLDEAKSILLDIEKDQKLKYKTEVIYYLALLDLKSENYEAARKKLVNYINTQEAQQKSKAQKILIELN